MSERVNTARAKWAAEMVGGQIRPSVDRHTATTVSVAVAAFVAGALFVETLDPFGPSSLEDCAYGLVKAGADPRGVGSVCRLMFPEPEPIDFSDVAKPVLEPPKPLDLSGRSTPVRDAELEQSGDGKS